MGTIYEVTTYFILTFMAVVITVYILGVSLLGRTIKLSQEEKEFRERENIEQFNKSLNDLNDEAKKTEGGNLLLIKKKIEAVEDTIRDSEQAIKKIQQGPKFLKVSGGVCIPFCLLFISLILIIFAIFLETNNYHKSSCLPFIFWIGAVILILYTIYHEYKILKVIQSSAIQTEDIYFKTTVAAFEKALHHHEISKKPIIRFDLSEPPIYYSGTTDKLHFYLSLDHGDIAIKPAVMFFVAPNTITFPKKHTWYQSSFVAKIGDFLSTKVEFNDLVQGINAPRSLTLKIPVDTGKYELYYKITCPGFDSGLEKLIIEVIQDQR